MLNKPGMGKLESERLKHFPNVNSLLKISLGLIFFTIISSALVYAETISVDIEGNSFDIDYTATGVTVTGIEPDLDFISLILTVDVTDSSGTLDITFDRSFFDSIFKSADDDFIILADGDSKAISCHHGNAIRLELQQRSVERVARFFHRNCKAGLRDECC